MESKPETTLEQLGPLAWQLTLALDAEKIDAEVERRLGEMRPRAEVRGFRRGKAPLAVVRRAYGARLREQQWERTAHSEVRRELAERGVRPVAAPTLEPADEGARVSARFEVFPELPALDFAKLELRRPVVAIGESDVDYMLERLGEPKVDADLANRSAELRQTMEAELPEAVEEELRIAVEEALVAAHPDLQLPAGLLEAQIERLHQAEGTRKPAEEVEAEARRLLTAALLLAESARQLGLRPDSAELWQETERLAAEARHPQEELDRIWADGELIHEIEDLLLRRRVVAAVLERAKVEDEPMGFEELARRRRARVE